MIRVLCNILLARLIAATPSDLLQDKLLHGERLLYSGFSQRKSGMTASLNSSQDTAGLAGEGSPSIKGMIEYEPSFRHNYTLESLLTKCVHHVCSAENIDYNKIPVRERIFLVRFRCPCCGMLPIYMLDLEHLNKVKCSVCAHIVTLRNRGKYGRVRKKVAILALKTMRSESLLIDSQNKYVVPWSD
jgi:hypothetical protein